MVVGCVETGYVLRVELPAQRRLCPIFVRDVGSPDIHECFRWLTGSQQTPRIWGVTCIPELRFRKETNKETEQYKTHNGQAQNKISWALISQEGRNHATSREITLNNDDRSCFGFNHFTCLHGIRFGNN